MYRRANTAALQDRAGGCKAREEEKAGRGFSPGAVILPNKSSESLAVSYNMGLCRWATSIPIFIPSDIRRSRAVPWPYPPPALSTCAPVSLARSRLSVNSVTKLRFRVADRRLISFYVLPEIRISRGRASTNRRAVAKTRANEIKNFSRSAPNRNGVSEYLRQYVLPSAVFPN